LRRAVGGGIIYNESPPDSYNSNWGGSRSEMQQQQRSAPVLVYRVESSDPDRVEQALDFLRNEHSPNCSTSRLIRNDEKQSWHAFLNVYRLVDKGPKVIHWTTENTKEEPYRDPDRCADEHKEAT